MPYAKDTSVPIDRSRAEIEKLLGRYGATAFGYLNQNGRSIVVFEIDRRRVLMELPMPDPAARSITHTGAGNLRAPGEQERGYQQAVRARWRALVLIVKAKLVAVEAGITTVEREFLADVALPDGTTVGQWVQPQLAAAYDSGSMPALLPGAAG